MHQVNAASIYARGGAQPYALVVHGFFEGALDSLYNPAQPAASSIVQCPVQKKKKKRSS